MTELEYLEHQYDEEWEEKRVEYNKGLISKYPWLAQREYDWDKESYFVPEDYDYSFTWLDCLPNGWRITFGQQLVEEIDQELKRVDFVDKYDIVQVKEKFGGLRWYTGGCPVDSSLLDIVHKYEDLSFEVCINCGKPVKYWTLGWINYVCEDCKNKLIEKDPEYWRENDFYLVEDKDESTTST